MQLERKQRILCGTIICCLWFTFFLHIFYAQNLYVTINFENCERSEKSDSYVVVVYDGLNHQEVKSGGIYEKSIREKFKLEFEDDLNINFYFSPITEKVRIKNIALYYNNIKISDLSGTEIENEFNMYNALETEKAENVLVLSKADEKESILIWKNYRHELKKIQTIQGMTMFALLVIIFLLSSLCIWLCKKNIFIQKKSAHMNSNIIMFVLLIVLSILIFFSYITGNQYFVFTMSDIGNDSINQNLPVLMEQARELESTGRIAPWSFQYGLGGEAQCDAFNYIMAIWGSDRLLYMLGLIAALKCVVSGMIFFQYAKLLEISNRLRYIAGISYAFCGHMIVRSAWFGYSKEVIMVAFLLYAIEKWVCHRKYMFIPIAYALLFVFSGLFVTAIWIVVGIGYYIMRKSLKREITISNFCKSILIWIILIAISILFASYRLVPSVIQMTGSNRVNSMVNSMIDSDNSMILYFVPYTLMEISKSVIRMFSNSILGLNQYSGVQNILADAPLYSGLFAILLIPQAIVIGEKRERRWNLFLYLVCAYYICFPTIRSVANAFSDKYNTRTSSFWINVVLIYVGINTLNHIVRERACKKILLIFSWLVECIYVVCVACFIGTNEAVKECVKIVFFITLTTISILFYVKDIVNKNCFEYILICICSFELVILSYPVINDRSVLMAGQHNNAYEDGTLELLSNLDDKAFYRLNKSYQSVGLNDALYQNYLGTRSYLGGTTHSNELLDFNEAIGVRNMYDSTSYLLGYDGLNAVNTMLGVKYNISRFSNAPYGYKMLESKNSLYLSENVYSLSLGYGYDSIISERDFYAMDIYDRRENLLNSVVVSDNSSLLKKNDIKYGKIINEHEKIVEKKSDIFEMDATESSAHLRENNLLSFPENGKAVLDVSEKEGSNLIIFLDIDASIRTNTYVTFKYERNDIPSELTKVYYLQEGENYIRIDLNGESLKQVTIKTERQVDFKIKEYSATYIDDSVYSLYTHNCMDRKRDILDISEMSGDYIKGNINVTESNLLFLSIPYNTNWHIYIDGRAVEVEKLNIAFMGCYITKGQHEVEIRYEKKNP